MNWHTDCGADFPASLAGYVHCGDCLHTMVRKIMPSHGKKYYYCVCSIHKVGEGCSSHSFSEAKLNKIVFALVQDHIRQIFEVERVLDYIASLPEQQRMIFSFDAQLTKLEEEIKRFQNLKLNLYGDISDGIISKEEYLAFHSGYDRKIQARQCSIRRLQEEREQAVESNHRRLRFAVSMWRNIPIYIWLIHTLITAEQAPTPTDKNFSVCWLIFMLARFGHWSSRIFPVSPVTISKPETCWRMCSRSWG